MKILTTNSIDGQEYFYNEVLNINQKIMPEMPLMVDGNLLSLTAMRGLAHT